MPAEKTQNDLMAKLKNKGAAAHKKLKSKPVQEDTSATLPSGIENGIAQLVECRFGEFKSGANKGEVFIYMAGVVVSPDDHEGTPIKGLRTQFGPHPLCDTTYQGETTSFQDNYDVALNELKKLGIDCEEIEFEDLPEVFDALKESKPFFRFRTWGGGEWTPPGQAKPVKTRVKHVWQGIKGLEDYTAEDDEQVDDSTEEDEPEVEETPAEEPEVEEAEAETADESDDLDTIIEAAETGDAPATQTLQAMAVKLGYTDAEVEDADSWTQVGEWIKAGPKKKKPAKKKAAKRKAAAKKPSLPELAEAADNGDSDAEAELYKICEQQEVDAAGYGTWAELVESGELVPF